MKRQFAMLFALTFLVSGMATFAEEAATGAENAETEMVENVENEAQKWVAPFEDGEWMSIPEWNAEVYMPAGWLLSEVTETGFIAVDAEETASMIVTMKSFVVEEAAETQEVEATAENEETVSDEIGESDAAVELSAFETYLMGLDAEYELSLLGEREMAVISGEESVMVKFPMNDLLVTMEFAPATEDGIADSALSIAETFYVYPETETAETDAETAEEAAAE